MKTQIIIDSAADINANEAEKLDLILIPMDIQFGNQIYRDGVDIDTKQFFEKLIESDDLPKTSQINPYVFEQTYKKIIDDGDEAIVITLSSKLSGTFSNAKLAANDYKNKIYVSDSLSACIGERLLIELAIKLREEKKQAKEIYEILEEKKKDIRLLAMLGTLKYLKKGGRISSCAAIAGELFNIKPVIAINNGEVKLLGKARGSKAANNLLIKMVEECGGIDFGFPFATAYSGLDNTIVKKYIIDNDSLWKDNVSEIRSFPIGSTIGTHIGPGAIAVAFFKAHKDIS